MVTTEDCELHRCHADQILARRLSKSATRKVLADHSRSSSSSPEPPIQILPTELCPDIISIPNTDCSKALRFV